MDTTNTIEIKLEQSGKTIVLKKYLTTGQSRELQRLLLSKGNFDVEKSSFENIPPEVFLDMQERALEFLAIEIKDDSGSQPFTKQMIDDLPVADGNKVYAGIDEIMGNSNLSGDERKK